MDPPVIDPADVTQLQVMVAHQGELLAEYQKQLNVLQISYNHPI